MTMRFERGFTLIEVMVSLVIVAFALTAAAAAMNQMIDNASTMRERTYASWIAQNKIAEMRLANVVPEVSTTSGELDYASTLWQWRAVVSETGVADFVRVDVSVSRVDSDYTIRTVTGFIGSPVPPGSTNTLWRASGNAGPTS
jgi:general secretion pathway protein I